MAETMRRPVAGGVITARFGDAGPRWTNKHTGLDFAAPWNTPIVASASGTVKLSGWHGDAYGNTVDIDHGSGIVTRYAHMSRTRVQRGASVKQGQIIGFVGNSGNASGYHVHLEVIVNGQARDPEQYLGRELDAVTAPSSSELGAAGLSLPSVADLQSGFLRIGMFVGGAVVIGIGVYLIVKDRGLL